jgi:hypothetical protein
MITAVVPAAPEQGADLAAHLAAVSGRVYDLLHTTGIGGYLIPDEALTWVLGDMRALAGDGPRLIEVPQQRLSST